MRFPLAVARDPDVQAWLTTKTPDVRRWYAALQACGDDVRELMHDGQATACVGDAAFAYVAAYRDHMNVGFFAGSELDDPDGLLEGTGRFMRHVKVRPGVPLDTSALEALIQQAYAIIKAA